MRPPLRGVVVQPPTPTAPPPPPQPPPTPPPHVPKRVSPPQRHVAAPCTPPANRAAPCTPPAKLRRPDDECDNADIDHVDAVTSDPYLVETPTVKQDVKSEVSGVGPVVVGITCITEMKVELDDVVADIGGGCGVVDMADITPGGMACSSNAPTPRAAATAPWRAMQPQTPPKANS